LHSGLRVRAMWSRFQNNKGRSLLVIAPNDAPAAAAAEAYLRVLPPMAVRVAAPSNMAESPGGCSSVAVFCSDVSKHFELDMSTLALCLEKLLPGGYVIGWLGGLKEPEVAKLETTALFAGAVDSSIDQNTPAADGRLTVEFSCFKPTWDTGAAAALPGMQATINEDDLLEDVPAPVGKGKSDCSTQPKACANCSCGRKELEDKVGAEEAKKRLEQGKERSACGSCYLGDAFRCDSCPYRGLPAFKGGTKVELVDGETEGAGQLGMRVDTVDGSGADGTGKLLINVA
jgi:hypothetical protein